MHNFDLPTPPPGHFWMVRAIMGMPMLELRKKVWFFSVCVDGIIPLKDGQLPEDRIKWAAAAMLDRLDARHQDHAFLDKHYGAHHA